MKKKSIYSLIITILFFAIIFISSFATVIYAPKDISNKGIYEELFLPSNVTEEKFIKGADLSSYAEIIEQSTYYNGKYTPYQDIVDEKTHEIFMNEKGEYANLFEILTSNGLNSIRLRIWNDPYDENGLTYGGGHNDIDTAIWITNEAKKFGIENVMLDFHYSDFWADPGRQWLPKEWETLTTTQLEEAIYNFTYESIEKFYNETNIFPAYVQIGNEITNGAFWSLTNTAPSGWKNFEVTAKYLKSAAKAIEDLENKIDKKTQTAIHLDGNISLKKWESILDSYLLSNQLIKYVDQIGITHYPDWNGNNTKLFLVMRLIKEKYGLDSYVSETAMPYTFEETNIIGDISLSQYKSYQDATVASPDSQIKLLNSIYETASRALPDSITGVYMWEPAWIMNGKNGWATKEGIKYAEPQNIENQNSFMIGNSWWNRGFFDKNHKALPVLNVMDTYRRVKDPNVETIKSSRIYAKSYSQSFEDDYIYKEDLLYNLNNTWREQVKLNDMILENSFNIEYPSSEIKKTVIEKFNSLNPGIIQSQIQYTDYQYDSSLRTGSFKVELDKNNIYYSKDSEIKIDFTVNSKTNLNFIDLTDQEPVELSEKFNSGEIMTYLTKQWEPSAEWDDLQSKLWETILPEDSTQDNYESWYKSGPDNWIAFWDEKNNLDRFIKMWIPLESDGDLIIQNNDYVDYYDLVETTVWPEKINKNKNELFIYLTKEVDYNLYGLENWRYLKTVAIKIPYTIKK